MASKNFLLQMLFHGDDFYYDFELFAVATIEKKKRNKLVKDDHHADVILLFFIVYEPTIILEVVTLYDLWIRHVL
jgi:hypothetical protein